MIPSRPATSSPPAPGAAAAMPRAGRTASAGPFDWVDFVIVDLETTGMSPPQARITEIGAVRMRAGQVRGQFCSLVNPGQRIPDQIAALTGIDDAMVAAAPPLADVLPAFLAFADGGVLAAHNAPFDIAFLAAACQECGLPWPGAQVLDTVDLAHRLLSLQEVGDCKLATLAAFFSGPRPCHRALADALAAADVLTGLLRRLAAAGVSTLAGIGSLAEIRGENAR